MPKAVHVNIFGYLLKWVIHPTSSKCFVIPQSISQHNSTTSISQVFYFDNLQLFSPASHLMFTFSSMIPFYCFSSTTHVNTGIVFLYSIFSLIFLIILCVKLLTPHYLTRIITCNLQLLSDYSWSIFFHSTIINSYILQFP